MISKQVQQKIIRHYDSISPYYQNLWSEHIHHGYYISGKESKKEATENLIKFLVSKTGVKRESKVLDIGCGVGGTSIWLAKNYNCDVTGITISPVQVEMAKKNAKESGIDNMPNFFVMDANHLSMDDKYDLLWAVEMISHLKRRKEFFQSCAKILNKGGKFCIADWFMKDGLSSSESDKYIRPIDERMLVSLWSAKEYIAELEKSGLKLVYHEDVSEKVKKTWDICVEIIRKKEFWSLAVKHGKEFVDFLKAFQDMRNGFNSKALTYEVMVFEKK